MLYFESPRNAEAYFHETGGTTICQERTCFTGILVHFSIENNNLSGTYMLHRNSGPLQYREQQSVRNAHASREFWATLFKRKTICQEHTCFTEILGPLQYREQQSVRNAHASQEF
jgi:hypothetical protein